MRSRRTVITPVVALSLAIASCSNTEPDTSNVSDDVELVRSSLARETQPAVSSEERTELGQGSREFALQLYAQARNGKTGNVFLSPYSVSVALAMTYAGAMGGTKAEMTSALHFKLTEPQLHLAWNSVDLALKAREKELVPQPTGGKALKLEVTNAIFAQSGFTPNAPFLDTLALSYDAGVYAADFVHNPERARLAINDWTADRTNDRIQELLPKGSLNHAVLVLLNAIYFKASWLSEFDAEKTRSQVFHGLSGDTMVQMMHGSAVRYAVGDGYQATELYYIAPSVRLLIVVPDAGRFDAIEAGFDAAFFDRVQGSLSNDYDVALGLPRFKIQGQTVSLADALKAMGMPTAFSRDADLSGIGGTPGELWIGDVLHQAFIEVNETGTEAAAATAVVVVGVSAPAPRKPVALTIDRPFLFAIYDEPTRQILFTGRVNNPG